MAREGGKERREEREREKGRERKEQGEGEESGPVQPASPSAIGRSKASLLANVVGG